MRDKCCHCVSQLDAVDGFVMFIRDCVETSSENGQARRLVVLGTIDGERFDELQLFHPHLGVGGKCGQRESKNERKDDLHSVLPGSL